MVMAKRRTRRVYRVVLRKENPVIRHFTRDDDENSFSESYKELCMQYVLNVYGPKKSESEESFVKALNKNGGPSFRLLLNYLFLYCYAAIIFVHTLTFDAAYFTEIRCEITELEKHFNFHEILKISYSDDLYSKKSYILWKEYCEYYVRNYTDLMLEYNYKYDLIVKAVKSEKTNSTRLACTSYVKNIKPLSTLTKNYRLTFKTWQDEYKLICASTNWILIFKIIEFSGRICSSLVFGIGADLYGRKRIFTITSIIHAAGLLIIFIPTKWCLIIGKFLIGFGEIALIILYILFLESCNATMLLLIGLFAITINPVANLLCLLLCSIATSWKQLHGMNATMLLILPVILYFVHESPRWLMFTGRKSEAWTKLNVDRTRAENNVDQKFERFSMKSIWEFYRTMPILRNRAILYVLLHCLNSSSTYFERFHLESLKLTPEDVFLLTAASQVLICMIGYVLAIKIGRREALLFFYILRACFNVTIFVKQYSIDSILAHVLMFGYRGISRTANMILIFYTAEAFPTPYRLTTAGFCDATAIIYMLISLYVINILESYPNNIKYLPNFVASVCSGLAVIFLPHIKNEGYPDTTYDALFLKETVTRLNTY